MAKSVLGGILETNLREKFELVWCWDHKSCHNIINSQGLLLWTIIFGVYFVCNFLVYYMIDFYVFHFFPFLEYNLFHLQVRKWGWVWWVCYYFASPNDSWLTRSSDQQLAHEYQTCHTWDLDIGGEDDIPPLDWLS